MSKDAPIVAIKQVIGGKDEEEIARQTFWEIPQKGALLRIKHENGPVRDYEVLAQWHEFNEKQDRQARIVLRVVRI